MAENTENHESSIQQKPGTIKLGGTLSLNKSGIDLTKKIFDKVTKTNGDGNERTKSGTIITRTGEDTTPKEDFNNLSKVEIERRKIAIQRFDSFNETSENISELEKQKNLEKFTKQSGVKNITSIKGVHIKTEKKVENVVPEKEEIITFKMQDKDPEHYVLDIVDEKKQDNRDKSLINQTLKHYKFLEFDNEADIADLQQKMMLQKILEERREDAPDEEITTISSSESYEQRNQRRKSHFGGHAKKKIQTVHEHKAKEIEIPEFISVVELAKRMSLKSTILIDALGKLGVHSSENDVIDGDTAELVVEDLDHIPLRIKSNNAEDRLAQQYKEGANIQPISPVVTIMGHVDHGKTSLLDAIRKTDVASREAGGITQHIGAYQVQMEDGRQITFIDTPGHEAFTAIRSRGANATDIVILVVDAGDGVMAQTVEAINHAKAAGTPIIVAANKIDKEGANLDRLKSDLLANELTPEDYGGNVPVIPVSALKGTGLKDLKERILLQADVMDLKADYACRARGIVLEARMDNKRGVVATFLIKNGTLKIGDIILAGLSLGRVKSMMDYTGKSVTEALPGMPVEVFGLDITPSAGEKFFVMESERAARDVIGHRKAKQANIAALAVKDTSDPFAALKKSESKEIAVIIRADVQGTVDAIRHMLDKISHDEVSLKVLQIAVGNVSEADILLAKTYKAAIFAFNSKIGSKEAQSAQKSGIITREHSIIYAMVDDIKLMLSDVLSSKITQTETGEAEVRKVFDLSKSGKIAGSIVLKGSIKRNAHAKVFRAGSVVFEGTIRTLKHLKEDVKDVNQGLECGIAIENFEGFMEKDIIRAYNITEEKRVI